MSDMTARLQFRMWRAVLVAVLAILAIGFDTQSGKSAEYPIHPIRIIVPWPAGGPTDAVARVLAQEVSSVLNQSVIVDNKAGATGTIGSEAAASPPEALWSALNIAIRPDGAGRHN
ncbi:MAG: hypothetical protein JO134_08175 [Xanthobacteraceae bacterium]|nr:hypothetical protein [Xanthobacteraceae bacterium]